MADGSKYLRCDECGDVLDRRAKDDFGGSRRNTDARGTFAIGEHEELLEYAKSLGWTIEDDRHVCPKHQPRSS
jgi:hypothetical protein